MTHLGWSARCARKDWHEGSLHQKMPQESRIRLLLSVSIFRTQDPSDHGSMPLLRVVETLTLSRVPCHYSSLIMVP
jgi:hypothetical protein